MYLRLLLMRAPHSYLTLFFIMRGAHKYLDQINNRTKTNIVYQLMINIQILSTKNYGRQ